MTTRKFYKTVYQIEVLSEVRIPDSMDLKEILEEAEVGMYSADITEESNTVLNGEDAAKELIKQRSSPEFFRLTPDGDDAD